MTDIPKIDIDNILKALVDLLPVSLSYQGYSEIKVTPQAGPVLPDRFNRASVTMDGNTYALSIFVPGDPTMIFGEKISGKLGADDDVIRFKSDHRDNPSLHQLYVGWARESLQIAHAACQELWDQSRWPASDIAAAMWEKVRQHIRTDAAWFEAAALEFMQPGGNTDQDFRIYAGESLRNLPAGEYTGYLQEKDGKLYFELSDVEEVV